MDEIYHWNTTEAWDQSAGERGLSETGNFIERYFPLLQLTVRAKKKLDGSLLAAVYFHDAREVGAIVTTRVYDYRGEPFELFVHLSQGRWSGESAQGFLMKPPAGSRLTVSIQSV